MLFRSVNEPRPSNQAGQCRCQQHDRWHIDVAFVAFVMNDGREVSPSDQPGERCHRDRDEKHPSPALMFGALTSPVSLSTTAYQPALGLMIYPPSRAMSSRPDHRLMPPSKETVIGIFDWERGIRQTVIIDLEMAADIRRSAETNDIRHTVDYNTVSRRITQFVEESSFELVETLAERITEILREEFGIPWVRLTLNKRGAIRGATDRSEEHTSELQSH